MRKVLAAVLIVLGAGAVCGCASKATPEQIQKMCENYGHLNGADQVPTKDALVADVNAMFERLTKDVEESRKMEQGTWDKELAARLATAKDDAEKAELQALYATKKQQVDDKYALDLAAFEPRKAEEIAKVDATIKKAQADLDDMIKKCTDKANAEDVTGNLAECRIGAKTIDMYNTVCY